MSYGMNEFGQVVGAPVADWTPPELPLRMPLEGLYARLEPLDPVRHAAALFRANAADADGRMWTYLSYGPFADEAEYRAWAIEMARRTDVRMAAIVSRETGRACGVAAFHRIDPALGSIEIGHVAFSPELSRTRVATEALWLMMDHAFALGYRRCEWKCDALNRASRAAAERLGFVYEGTFRQAGVYKGRNRDTAWFAALDGDAPRLRKAMTIWLAPANFDAAGRQRTKLEAAARPEWPAASRRVAA